MTTEFLYENFCRALDLRPDADTIICVGPDIQILPDTIQSALRLMEQDKADALFLCHGLRHCIYRESAVQIEEASAEDRPALIERGSMLLDRKHPPNWGYFETDFCIVKRTARVQQFLQIWESLGGDAVSLPTAMLAARSARWMATSRLDLADKTQFVLSGALTRRYGQCADHVALVEPCRGRATRTNEQAEELRESAGMPFEQINVVDGDPEVAQSLLLQGRVRTILHEERQGYWKAMVTGTHATRAKYLVNLANDLMPGKHWLKRALTVFKSRFEGPDKDGDGVVGFNDGLHEAGHSSHFVINRKYLEKLGGWPVWYDHNFGDTEICARAQAEGKYEKAPYAVLYHRHWITGGKKIFDETYAEATRSMDADSRLFELRKNFGWPHPNRPEDTAKFAACMNMSKVRLP